MNVVTPFTSSTPAISEAERARRLSEVNFARGSVRYEGGRGGSVYLNSSARLLIGASAGFMPLREAAG
jgi:hypothetical protein